VPSFVIIYPSSFAGLLAAGCVAVLVMLVSSFSRRSLSAPREGSDGRTKKKSKKQSRKGRDQTPREGTPHSQVNQQKGEKTFEDNCEDWCDAVNRAVQKKFFLQCQFIVHKADEAFGSPWQKKLCEAAAVPEDKQEDFWGRTYHGGKKAARKALNTKRMNVTREMKQKFFGEGWCWLG
jgi:3-oxoacyl-[acyl-carrier-protein] synthase III